MTLHLYIFGTRYEISSDKRCSMFGKRDDAPVKIMLPHNSFRTSASATALRDDLINSCIGRDEKVDGLFLFVVAAAAVTAPSVLHDFITFLSTNHHCTSTTSILLPLFPLLLPSAIPIPIPIQCIGGSRTPFKESNFEMKMDKGRCGIVEGTDCEAVEWIEFHVEYLYFTNFGKCRDGRGEDFEVV